MVFRQIFVSEKTMNIHKTIDMKIYGGASILSTQKCLYESVETVPLGGSSGDGPPRRESRSRSLNPE